MTERSLYILLVGILVVLASAACSQLPVSPTAEPRSATPTPTRTQLSPQQLSAIQPGLGTVMIEYATLFANAWFAAQAGNWNMARYQVFEMTEVQEVGETTRPARAPALKAFENGFLSPLEKAAKAEDLVAFTSAYDRAITGCNSCHASQTSSEFPDSYGFIKIQRPTGPVLTNVDWKGQ